MDRKYEIRKLQAHKHEDLVYYYSNNQEIPTSENAMIITNPDGHLTSLLPFSSITSEVQIV